MIDFYGRNPMIRNPDKRCPCQITPEQLNNATFIDYFTRLKEIAINMIEWDGLPDTIDPRFLEMTINEYGWCVYFNDEVLGELTLPCMIGGKLNLYRTPITRQAYSYGNGYHKTVTDENSVLIFNNYLRTPTDITLALYAQRLTEIERAIEVNVKAQKTPITFVCDESQKKTIESVINKIDRNNPYIILAAKNVDVNTFKALNTSAPFVSAELQTLKRQLWNEALTFCGIENANTEKKERLVTDEITSNMGGVIAQRYTRLNARREAAEQINKMFNREIHVNFRTDYQNFNLEMPINETGGEIDGGIFNYTGENA